MSSLQDRSFVADFRHLFRSDIRLLLRYACPTRGLPPTTNRRRRLLALLLCFPELRGGQCDYQNQRQLVRHYCSFQCFGFPALSCRAEEAASFLPPTADSVTTTVQQDRKISHPETKKTGARRNRTGCGFRN